MRVLVIDKFDICREGMKNILLSMDGSCEFFEAATVEEGAAVAENEKNLDLIIIDMDMPEGDGAWVLNEIKNSSLNGNIILLSTTGDAAVVRKAQEMGISAFLEKQIKKEIILSVFQIVLAGGRYFSPEAICDYSVSKSQNLNDYKIVSPDHWPLLSKRQLQVLKLLAEGKPNKVIARDLEIATGTVKVHIAGILKALKAKNRTQAVSVANHIKIL